MVNSDLSDGFTTKELKNTKLKIDPTKDGARRWGQFALAVILIGSCISYIGYYALYLATPEFQLELASEMKVLVIMGVGAALAYFGLGRTVGKGK